MTAAPSNIEKSILEHFYQNARAYFSKSQHIKTDAAWKREDNLDQPR